MDAKPALRAVGSDERPVSRKKQTVEAAAAGGDQLELLVAMRDRIAKAVSDEKCPPRDLAALTKRLDDIVEKIAALKDASGPGDAGGAVDDEAFDATAI